MTWISLNFHSIGHTIGFYFYNDKPPDSTMPDTRVQWVIGYSAVPYKFQSSCSFKQDVKSILTFCLNIHVKERRKHRKTSFKIAEYSSEQTVSQKWIRHPKCHAEILEYLFQSWEVFHLNHGPETRYSDQFFGVFSASGNKFWDTGVIKYFLGWLRNDPTIRVQSIQFIYYTVTE